MPNLRFLLPSLVLLTVTSICLPTKATAQVAAVTGFVAEAYDHHIELHWNQHPNPFVQGYRVYGAVGDGPFTLLAFRNNVQTSLIDFLGDWDVEGRYYVRAVDGSGNQGQPSDTISATTFEMTDEQLLDMVQAYTFRYFWDFGHPVSGLARERNSTSTVTSGGSGFGVMAIIVGAERGFITYDEALTRTKKIVDFLATVPRFKGAFSHWMNGATGAVIPFSPLDNGGDLVETSFLIQGLLTARQYYAGNSDEEVELRTKITQLWEEVNWNWYRRQVGNVLYWHWSPNNEFAINLPIRGFDETHITYLLAIASPVDAHNIPPSLYHTGWAGSGYQNNLQFYGYPLEVGRNKGGPLFFSHYSYLGFDPRGIADQYTNYFVRNTYQTLINYAHCVDNPYNRVGYSENAWGLTASDNPDGYLAHAPDNANVDNGTITPTAALSSMPYTPTESLRALKYFYRELGENLWGQYGFYDAYNLGRNWFANSYLAIDQGPIICMIENYRTGLLWDLFMANPEIAPALAAVGFSPDSSVVNGTTELPGFLANRPVLYPNPTKDFIQLQLNVTQATDLQIDLLSPAGQFIKQLASHQAITAAQHTIRLNLTPGLAPGVYFIRLRNQHQAYVLPFVLTNF